jgi:hypothetical protein
MKFRVPVDFTIVATNPERAEKAMQEFLRDMFKDQDTVNHHGVIDFELPVGYPSEAID